MAPLFTLLLWSHVDAQRRAHNPEVFFFFFGRDGGGGAGVGGGGWGGCFAGSGA